MTIKLTPKQQTTAREFQNAIMELQQRQQAYLKAILDANEIEPNSNWDLTPDCSGLVQQGKPVALSRK